VALRAQVVDFIRLGLLDDANQIGGVRKITVVQYEIAMIDMRVLVQVIDSVSVEQAGTTLDAMNPLAFLEQEFGQVGPILTSDPSNERNFGRYRHSIFLQC